MTGQTAPLHAVDDPAPEPGLLRRRWEGTYELDPWGMDEDLTLLASRLAALRWTATITGQEHLPANGPALLVANRRVGWSEPLVLASVLARRTGWAVRPVGGPTVEPLAGLLRRFGAIPARAAEVDAALRAGNRVLVPTRREALPGRAGHLPVEFLAPAVTRRIPLVPVAVVGWEFRRRWDIRIGAPVRVTEASRGLGDDARLVGAAAVEVSTVLGDLLAEQAHAGVVGRLVSALRGSQGEASGRRWEVS